MEWQSVPGRNCDECTLCCKLLAIQAINKPDGQWCPWCKIGHGCTRYDDRPDSCRKFACNFLKDAALSEAWRPNKCHIVLRTEDEGRRLMVTVDPSRPQAWKNKLHYEQLKTWSRLAWPRGGQVFVVIGKRVIAILPDRELDLGLIEEGDQIEWGSEISAQGRRFNVWRSSKPT